MQLVSQSPQDTWAIAKELVPKILSKMRGSEAATTIALRGDLGAGKTTFTQGLAKALGITQQPKSPTFLLAKEYLIPDTTFSLWHLDCYRLSGREDLIPLDLHSLFRDPNNLIVVEWPERIGDGLPRDHIEIHMTHAGGDARGITIRE
jgi:tRNA threonylcarbamoyladenosine biosynthesis protein TsaE